MDELLDRAYGALIGGAIGDAMGMPASFLTRKQIKETYGYIEDFLQPDASVQEYHGELQAGEITDDTMESVILSRVLIDNPEFTEEAFNKAMRCWAVENRMLESTVIGPSTRRYLTALIDGRDPKPGAKQGNTNGSAMRAAPVGIRYWNDLGKCLDAAVKSSLPSHGSAPAVAAACAVAGAVAAGVHGGYSALDVLHIACEGAEYGEKHGEDITAPSVSRRIRMAEHIVDEGAGNLSATLDELVGIFGASMFAYESVPLSVGVFYAANGSGPDGVLSAINSGDDADTNGAICGNLCGAFSGASSFPQTWRERVERTSSLDLTANASALLHRN